MTNGFLDQINNEGWKIFKVEKDEDRKASCWVSPEGDWYNVSFADHPLFAEYVMKEMYPADLVGKTHPEYGWMLKQRGWLLVHHDVGSGVMIGDSKKMSPDQFVVLFEFFGDQPLFRMRTIKVMWRESENNPEKYCKFFTPKIKGEKAKRE